MKGVTILFDEARKKRIVQIDLDRLSKDPEAIEDLLDGLIAEQRRNEPTVSHEAVVRSLKKRAARKRATPWSGRAAQPVRFAPCRPTWRFA